MDWTGRPYNQSKEVLKLCKSSATSSPIIVDVIPARVYAMLTVPDLYVFLNITCSSAYNVQRAPILGNKLIYCFSFIPELHFIHSEPFTCRLPTRPSY